MITVHRFTHASGYTESANLAELQQIVADQNLAGEYSERQIVDGPEPQHTDVTVSTYQAKAALALAGRYDEVDAYMRLDSTDRLTKLKWEYLSFKRSDPAVLQIAAALGMTDAELDQLFALAATIE